MQKPRAVFRDPADSVVHGRLHHAGQTSHGRVDTAKCGWVQVKWAQEYGFCMELSERDEMGIVSTSPPL